MRILILTLLLLTSAVPAQQSDNFPADPAGAQVVDRAHETLYSDSGTAHFYALMTTRGDQSTLAIYKGLPWRKVHTWPLEFQGSRVRVPDNAVLHIEGSDQQVVFYWEDFAGYREGAVRLSLTYDRATGTFNTNWSD